MNRYPALLEVNLDSFCYNKALVLLSPFCCCAELLFNHIFISLSGVLTTSALTIPVAFLFL